VRGGIAMLNVSPLGAVQADLLHGQVTVTSIVAATGEIVTRTTNKAGQFIAVEPNQAPNQAKKRGPDTLAAMTNALERKSIAEERPTNLQEPTGNEPESEAEIADDSQDSTTKKEKGEKEAAVKKTAAAAEKKAWFYPDSPDTSLRVDNPHLEVKNAKKTIYSRI
jgi:hypothetical protein